jgi:hypothetical protein
VNPIWKNLLEKGKGDQLNVGDVNEIICTYIVLIRDIEGGLCTTYKRKPQWKLWAETFQEYM